MYRAVEFTVTQCHGMIQTGFQLSYNLSLSPRDNILPYTSPRHSLSYNTTANWWGINSELKELISYRRW